MDKLDDPWEIGQDFFYGIGRRKNYRRAFPYLLEAARLNHPHCQNLVGYCFGTGSGYFLDQSGLFSVWANRRIRKCVPL